MNKKVLIAVAVVVILALAGFYLKSKKSDSTVSESQSVTKTISEASEWANAIKSGKPTVCTMTRSGSSMEYYVEGKKMRADITTTAEDKSTLSHMINDGAYLYIWSDGQAQGSKTAIPSEEEVKQMADDTKKYQDQTKNTPDFGSESGYDQLKTDGYSVNCNGVVSDSSKLVPPTTVSFIDPAEIMKKVSPQSTNGVDIGKLQEMAKQYQPK